MKCDICNEKVQTTILGKVRGSYFKVNSKKKLACHDCQSKLKTKEEIIKALE